MLPATLKGFTAFIDGRGYLGVCTSGSPPKIAVKTEEFRDGGMDGAIELDMGTDKLELTMEFAEYNADIYSQVGIMGRDVPVTLRGSMETEDGSTIAIEHTGTGLFKEADPGEWKPGDKSQLKVMVSLRYYRLTIDGAVTHEIDLVNVTRIIGGDDQLAARRAALGI